ncbi:MAG: Rhomboid protease GlpG [bacterium]|nr:Rhomboid protease GlpG [bacterium]
MTNQSVGAIVCPNCGKLISRNAETCIHCGYRNPGLWGVGPKLKHWLERFGFTQAVMAVCLALYAVALLLNPSAIFRSRGGILQMLLGFLSPDGVMLDRLGMTGSYAMQDGRWWTLITAIYLHGSLPHILFNLMGLHQLAPAVEELFGTSRLIVIFTFAGVLGFLISFFAGVAFTIGASGSLFGLLGALVYYGKSRGGRFGESVYSQALQFAVIMFVYGFMMSGIVNNWAHAGGFAGGYLAAMLLGYSEKSKENYRMQLWGVAAIAVTVLAFVLALWRALTTLA